MPATPLDLPDRLEARRGPVEIPTRDLRPREHLERRDPLQPSVLGQLAQEPLGELGGPRGIAAVEREAGAAELLGGEGAGPVEQRRGLRRPSLASPQLRQPGERRRRPGRAGGRVVLVRCGEHCLRLRPAAVPEVDGPVLAAAEGEHVAAPVALCELGDAVAPLAGPLEVEHGGAGADQQAARPGARDRDRRLVLECRRGGLVEVAHALGDVRRGDEHRALEREAEDLEVRDGEAPAELGGERREAARGGAVARRVGEEPVVECEPAVIRARLQLVEQAMGAPEPAVRDRGGAVEVELVGGDPRRHAGGGRRVALGAVEPVRALARGEDRLRVVEPPGRPAQALERLRRLACALERRAGRLPASRPQLRPAELAAHERIVAQRSIERYSRTASGANTASRPTVQTTDRKNGCSPGNPDA